MSRPKAGHAKTAIFVGDRTIWLIQDDRGIWYNTGAAATWPRCLRCRCPERMMPYDQGLCPTCFFYHNGMSPDQFWRLHDQGFPLAPYNIGKRGMENMSVLYQLNDAPSQWRSILRSQIHGWLARHW